MRPVRGERSADTIPLALRAYVLLEMQELLQ